MYKSNPIFDSIMNKIKSMPESERMTPTGRQLWRLASKHAPPELLDMIVEIMQKKGLFPKPTHCGENGEDLYSLDELADFYGASQEEREKAYQEMIHDDPDICEGFYHGPVYPIQ